jgi:hypothetical protein
VGRDFRVSAAAVRRALTRNTALVVASAPCFPHGVMDDVAGIAEARLQAPALREQRRSALPPGRASGCMARASGARDAAGAMRGLNAGLQDGCRAWLRALTLGLWRGSACGGWAEEQAVGAPGRSPKTLTRPSSPQQPRGVRRPRAACQCCQRPSPPLQRRGVRRRRAAGGAPRGRLVSRRRMPRRLCSALCTAAGLAGAAVRLCGAGREQHERRHAQVRHGAQGARPGLHACCRGAPNTALRAPPV